MTHKTRNQTPHPPSIVIPDDKEEMMLPAWFGELENTR
jgi:hypothetical protein